MYHIILVHDKREAENAPKIQNPTNSQRKLRDESRRRTND